MLPYVTGSVQYVMILIDRSVILSGVWCVATTGQIISKKVSFSIVEVAKQSITQ